MGDCRFASARRTKRSPNLAYGPLDEAVANMKRILDSDSIDAILSRYYARRVGAIGPGHEGRPPGGGWSPLTRWRSPPPSRGRRHGSRSSANRSTEEGPKSAPGSASQTNATRPCGRDGVGGATG